MIATDKPVVVFGGGGFVGRALTQELLSRGHRVRIAQRVLRTASTMRSLGNMGAVQLVHADITNSGDVAAVLAGASAAVNLVGLLRGDMASAHVVGAQTVARAAAAEGLDALIQISAIGADPESQSAYGRTKGEGEAAVRAAFPGATIIRPSIIFGRDDQFTNRFARLIATGSALPFGLVPLIRGGTRFQPIHVADVARAIAVAIDERDTLGGQTYEIGGPDVLTLGEINRWIAGQIGRTCNFLPIPDNVAGPLASAIGWAPGAPITRDQYLMLLSDNVVSPGAKGLESFGIRPAPMAALAPGWLTQYRRQGRFGSAVDA